MVRLDAKSGRRLASVIVPLLARHGISWGKEKRTYGACCGISNPAFDGEAWRMVGSD